MVEEKVVEKVVEEKVVEEKVVLKGREVMLGGEEKEQEARDDFSIFRVS